jgi:hypothetical protein
LAGGEPPEEQGGRNSSSNDEAIASLTDAIAECKKRAVALKKEVRHTRF